MHLNEEEMATTIIYSTSSCLEIYKSPNKVSYQYVATNIITGKQIPFSLPQPIDPHNQFRNTIYQLDVPSEERDSPSIISSVLSARPPDQAGLST